MPKIPKPPIADDLAQIIAAAVKKGLKEAKELGGAAVKEASEVAGKVAGKGTAPKAPKPAGITAPTLPRKGTAPKAPKVPKPAGITAPKSPPKSAPKTASGGKGSKPPKAPKLSASGQEPRKPPRRPSTDKIPEGKNLPTTNAAKRAAEKQANFLTKDLSRPRGRPMGDRSNTSGPVAKKREKMSSIPKLDKAAQARQEIARDRALFTTKGPRSVVTASSEMERLKAKLASAKPDRKDYWSQRIKEAKGK